jgi:hypothetical protein
VLPAQTSLRGWLIKPLNKVNLASLQNEKAEITQDGFHTDINGEFDEE